MAKKTAQTIAVIRQAYQQVRYDRLNVKQACQEMKFQQLAKLIHDSWM